MFRFLKNHRRAVVGIVVLLVGLLWNVLTFLHAYSLTHYVAGAAKTEKLEKLTFWQKSKLAFTGPRMPRPTNSTTPAEQGLEFETCQIAEPSGVTLEAWYIPGERRRDLCLLFHGYGQARMSLLSEAAVLHEWGYSTLLVDFRGSGGSSGSITTIGYHEADDVAAAVDYARHSLSVDQPILFGRSMGAVAVLRAVAIAGVYPKAVILECPFDRLLTTTENRFAALGAPAFPTAQLLVFWGGFQQGYSGFAHNPAEYAGEVRCPALLLHGARDPRVTQPQAQNVFEHLAGPKQFVLFAEAAHEAYLRKNAEQWRGAVRDFLDRYAVGEMDPVEQAPPSSPSSGSQEDSPPGSTPEGL